MMRISTVSPAIAAVIIAPRSGANNGGRMKER
jgi:hypothetical protein